MERPSAYPICTSEPEPEVKRQFYAAGSITGGQECFGPGSIVAIQENAFSTVHGNGLSIGSHAAHTQFKFQCFFNGTLSQQADMGRLSADQNGNGIERSNGGYPDSGSASEKRADGFQRRQRPAAPGYQ